MSSRWARRRAFKRLGAFAVIAVLAGGMTAWFFSSGGPGGSQVAEPIPIQPERSLAAVNGGDYYGDAIADLTRAVIDIENALIALSEGDVEIRGEQARLEAELEATAELLARLAAAGGDEPADVEGLSAAAIDMNAAAAGAGDNQLDEDGESGGLEGGDGGAAGAPSASGGAYAGLLAGKLSDLDDCALEAVARQFPEYLIRLMIDWDADAALSDAELASWRRVFEREDMEELCADRLSLSVERSKGRRNASYRDACYSYFIRSAVVEYAGERQESIVSSPRAAYRVQGFYDGIYPSVVPPEGAAYEVDIGGGSVNPWLWGVSRLNDHVDNLLPGDDYWRLRWLGRHIERAYGESACVRWRPSLFGDDMRYSPWDEIEPDTRDVVMIEGLRGPLHEFDEEIPTEEMMHLSRAPFERVR